MSTGQAALDFSAGLLTTEHELRRRLLDDVARLDAAGKLARCQQCGTCTGSCPVSYAMDITPRGMIARVRAGDIDSVLASRSIWLCASCYACTARCPAGVPFTDFVYALKRLALARGGGSGRAFTDAFRATIGSLGRNHEPLFMLRYYARVGLLGLVKRTGTALRLLVKRRLPFLPRRIAGIGELRGILGRSAAAPRDAAGTRP